MTRDLWLLAVLVAGLSLPGCRGTTDPGPALYAEHDETTGAAGDDDDDHDADEHEIALADVPANVLAAARAALPGATLVEAGVEAEDGVTVYVLDAVRDGVEYEIAVSADGRVLEVEQDD